MIDFWSFWDVLKKPKPNPYVDISHDFLYDEALTLGTFIGGMQGTGKTSTLVDLIHYYRKNHPNEAIFVLDPSRSFRKDYFELVLQDDDWREELEKIIYDDMGNPEWTLGLPEFSEKYGSQDENVWRVAENLKRINPDLANSSIIGVLGLTEATNFFKLLTAIVNEYGESWQLTETKSLIYDLRQLKDAIKKYGSRVPDAALWLENRFLGEGRDYQKPHQQILDTKAIIGTLEAIEPCEVRARLGCPQPGWTPKEAIEKGLLVICDGSRLSNKPQTMNYLFMQVYKLIIDEIHKREPDNPNDLPVTLVMDEVYSLLRIPGMAPEIASLSPQYRSRKLQLFIVLQSLAQMSYELRPHIWSLGNQIIFRMSNKKEAYEIAEQLFQFDPYFVKVAPTREGQHPIMESLNEQYSELADWIQNLDNRQCIIRRYKCEQSKPEKIVFVPETYELPKKPLHMTIDNALTMLLRRDGKRVREVLSEVNNRKIPAEVKKKEPEGI